MKKLKFFLVLAALILSAVSYESQAIEIFYIDDAVGSTDDGVCDGTPACATWNHVYQLLGPGDTLIVRSGNYTMATGGRATLKCAGAFGPIAVNAVDGTAVARITVRAETERQAHINGAAFGDGFGALDIYNCDYWTIIGLDLTYGDVASAPNSGTAIWLENSDNNVIQRNLTSYANRYCNCSIMGQTNGSDGNLWEENEGYYCHRDCFQIEGNNNIVRRNYINSRSYADIMGGYASNFPLTGDFGFGVYSCQGGSNNIFENNISENNAIGFRVSACAAPTDANHFYGNISLNDYGGWQGGSREARGSNQDSINFVVVSPLLRGWYNIGGENVRCINCSVFLTADDAATTDWGYRAVQENQSGEIENPINTLVRNSFSMGTPINYSYEMLDHSTWTLDYTASHSGAVGDYNPNAPHANITNRVTNVPTNMGATGCYAYVHASSNMKGAGLSGADVGANVLYPYVNGIIVPTMRLWDSNMSGAVDGTFARGATITGGINDDAIHNNDVLEDIHERLNINTAGCPFPAGYTTSPGTPPLEPFTYSIGSTLQSVGNGGSHWSGPWACNPADTTIVQNGPAGSTSGGGAAQASSAGGTFTAYCERPITALDAATENTFPISVYPNDCSPTSTNSVFGVFIGDHSNSTPIRIQSGQWQMYDNDVAGYVNVAACNENAWNLVEVNYDDTAQPEKYRVRINSGTYSAYRTVAGGSLTTLTGIWIQSTNTEAHSIYWDDIGTAQCVAAELAWAVQPTSSVVAGQSLGTMQVSVVCADGETLVTTATNEITLAATGGTCTGMTFNTGDKVNNAVAGAASFSGLSLTGTPGSCTITASAAGLTSAISNTITLNITSPVVPGRARIRARIR